MSRLATVVFGVLVAATAGAFFVVQHLKVSTPLIAGFPAPNPAVFSPHSPCRDRRQMRISFYLLHRSDDVDVYVIDAEGQIVATLASGRHMQGGVHPVRTLFVWDGREDDGSLAPDGTYYIKVDLIHQGRTVIISPTGGGPASPVRIETRAPAPRVLSVSPRLIPRAGSMNVTIRFTGNEGHVASVLLYRTDLAGRPRLVKSFLTPGNHQTAVWDGLIHGHRAPPGVYLVGLSVTDAACNTGRFPILLPPVPRSTPGAGVTVRYLAAQPPLVSVHAGSTAVIYVDSRHEPYHWALHPAGLPRALEQGSGSSYMLSVRAPHAPGLYELAIRSGSQRTVVPLVDTGSRARVLVVLPALSWQGENPVDDDGDGLPNTLSSGQTVSLSRPLANGLPDGWEAQAAFVRHLTATHRPFELTTDLGLIQGVGPGLSGHSGVILAGSARWISGSLAGALRAYVSRGGRVLSLGLNSLRGVVAVRGSTAAPVRSLGAVDAFGVRHGAFVAHDTGLAGVLTDSIGLFDKTSGVFSGFSAYEPVTGVAKPGRVVASAGTSSSAPSIVAVRLGSGTVVEVGVASFEDRLARNLDVRELFAAVWSLLGG